jgi:ATP-binding cassette subfamily B protein
MHILWRYLRPHRKLAALSLLLAGLSQVLALVDPIIFGMIIDEYAGNPGNRSPDELLAGVFRLLGLAVVVAVLSRLAKALQEYLTRLVVQKFGTQIFNDGLRQTLRLDFQEFEDQRSGETLSTLLKVRTDTERFINAFINVLFAALVGVGFLVWYSVTKHWALVPVFLVGVLVLGGLTGLLSREIKAQQRSIVRETARNSGFITESLRNIELIKSLGLTFPEIRRLQAQTVKVFGLEMQKVKRIRLLSFLQGTTLSLLRHSILFTLLWLIFRNVLTTGELIAMQFISVAIFAPLQELGNIILAYREAEASLLNFENLMAKPVDRRPQTAIPVGPVGRLSFAKVVFRHKGAVQNALDDVSFSAALGDTVAFVGPSGSGKSTLVKLLVGLYRPDSGEIFYNDVSTRRMRYNEARRQIGFVTQETHLFAGTIRENMQFVKPDVTDEEIVRAMEQASCVYLLQASPLGLSTPIGEMGMKLSGGERQRLSIARALLRDAPVLILDEPTAALDAATEASLLEALRTLMRNRTTLVIAHRLSTIRNADRIVVLEQGRIAEQGTHDELLDLGGIYADLHAKQTGTRRAMALAGQR